MLKHFYLLTVVLFFQICMVPIGAVAQTFSPNQFSDLVLWLRADSALVKDGSNFVSSWEDVSGVGNHFNQLVPVSQPQWIPNALNGKPVIRFDGSDFLSAGNVLNVGTNSRTAFIVAKRSTSSGFNALCSKGVIGPPFYSLYYYDDILYYDYRYGSATFIASPSTSTVYYVFSALTNRATNTNSLFVNSANVGSIAIPSNADINSTSPFLLGGYSNGTQWLLNGDIAEFIIYDRALSNAERNQVEHYLDVKYAGEINLGPDLTPVTGSLCSVILDVGLGFTSYQWSPGGATTQTLLVSQPGTYSVSARDGLGYIQRDTINISFIEAPDTIILCPDSTATIGTGLTGVYTYSWSTGVNTSTINVTQAGTYRVTVSDGSCSRIDSSVVVMNSFPTMVSLGADDSLCIGNVIGLQTGAQLVSSYLWSPGGGTTPTISVAGTGTATYSVTVTDQLGCRTNDTILVTIAGTAPTADFVADTVCLGLATSFTNNSLPAVLDSFLWEFGGGNIAIIENPSFTFDSSGIHNVTLTVTSGTICKGSVTKPVFVKQGPSVNLNVQTDACINNPYTFVSSSSAGPGDTIIGYHWSFGDGSMPSTLQSPSHVYTSTGSKTVTFSVLTLHGCTKVDSGTLNVDSSAPPAGAFTLNHPQNGFIAGDDPINFSWNPGTGAVKYELQVSTLCSFSQVDYRISNITSLNYSLAVSPGNYCWRIVAFNACGDITYSSDTNQFSAIDIGALNCLSLWLRADGIVEKDANDSVSSWVDVSPAGFRFDSATAASQPKWVDNAMNGKPVIRFNGSEDFLSGGDVLDIGTNSRTIFTAGTTNASNYTFYAKSEDSDNRFGFVGAGTLFAFLIVDGDGNQLTTSAPVGNSIFTYKADRGQESLSLYRNGTQQGNAAIVANDLNTNVRFLLGAYNQNPGGVIDGGQAIYLNGDFAEMIMSDCALPDNERIQVEQYLRFKYAPQINLGPDVTVTSGVCPITLDIGPYFTEIEWSTTDVAQNISLNTGGTYWVTAHDIFGYETSDTIVIDFPYHGMTPGDTIVCLDESVSLTQLISPLTGITFQWFLDGNVISGATSVTYNATAAGNYFAIISGNSCSISSDTISITVDTFKLHSLLPLDTTICGGNDIAVDAGQNTVTSYLWSTGSSDTTSNLVINSTGNYSVTVTDINLCRAIDTILVTIKGVAPNTDFTVQDLCLGDSIIFNNSTVQILPDSIHFWLWTFGDGDSLQLQTPDSPGHLYSSTNVYSVTLFVVTDSGCTGIKTKSVGVYPYPVADFNYAPDKLCAQTTPFFTNNTFVPFPFTGTDSIWLWVFNNADSFDTENVAYTIPDSGMVPVFFTVTTNRGCSDTFRDTIQVFEPLIADFSFSNVCYRDFTLFTDSSRGDTITNWYWDFDDGSFPSSLQNTQHQYPTADTFTARLIIRNSIGCVDTAVKQVPIVLKPVASFESENVCLGFVYAPQDNSISLSEPITLWEWNINDSLFYTKSPQYLFTGTGVHPVQLTVTTASGCTDDTVRTVTVSPNPSAIFSFTPLYGDAPLDVTFINQSTNTSSYVWNFGDGSIFSTDAEPMHTYLENDTFDIALIVTSDSGCVGSSIQRLIVDTTTLDIAVDDVETEVVHQTDGSALISVTAQISNVGTRLITSAKLYAMLGGGGVITEDLDSNLAPGETRFFIFDAQFVVANGNAETYVCVEARNVNNGQTEARYDNNVECTSLNGAIQLMGPFPNPVSDKSVLGIILPKTGRVRIAIVDAIGQYVYKDTEFVLPAGRSDFEIPAHQLSAAEYFIRVTYNDEKFVRKFMVKK